MSISPNQVTGVLVSSIGMKVMELENIWLLPIVSGILCFNMEAELVDQPPSVSSNDEEAHNQAVKD